MSSLSRRRFIAISASAAAGLALGPIAAATHHSWRGTALGARATIRLEGADPRQAADLIEQTRLEIARLENLFSLYQADSAITRLNTQGYLADPDPEFLSLLTTARSVYEATHGIFDPTVQPLWAALAALHAKGPPDRDEIYRTGERLSGHINLDGVVVSPESIRFAKAGMAMTLNGIAQGYITDRITALFHRASMKNVLIEMGEIRAIGPRSDGTPWRVGIADPDNPAKTVRTVTLAGRALATSATLGTVFDSGGTLGHILNPHTGRAATSHRLVSVEAPNAALADALSTALCLMPQKAATAAIRQFDDCRIVHLGSGIT